MTSATYFLGDPVRANSLSLSFFFSETRVMPLAQRVPRRIHDAPSRRRQMRVAGRYGNLLSFPGIHSVSSHNTPRCLLVSYLVNFPGSLDM